MGEGRERVWEGEYGTKTVPGMGRGLKENGGGGEFKYNTLDIL
jgi:hypothetical protein